MVSARAEYAGVGGGVSASTEEMLILLGVLGVGGYLLYNYVTTAVPKALSDAGATITKSLSDAENAAASTAKQTVTYVYQAGQTTGQTLVNVAKGGTPSPNNPGITVTTVGTGTDTQQLGTVGSAGNFCLSSPSSPICCGAPGADPNSCVTPSIADTVLYDAEALPGMITGGIGKLFGLG